MINKLQKIIVITGHYGSGKTNLALNLALVAKKNEGAAGLADLDVVNPYFRAADFKETAKQNGILLFASDYANSNLDVPALSGGFDIGLRGGHTFIVDVGGDDAGAFALGRYAPRINEKPYSMLYVVNAYRYLTREPYEAAELLKDIEAASRLKATHVVNCSNLGTETTAEDVLKSHDYAEKVAGICGIPLLFTAADRRICGELKELQDLMPVDIYVKTPWN